MATLTVPRRGAALWTSGEARSRGVAVHDERSEGRSAAKANGQQGQQCSHSPTSGGQATSVWQLGRPPQPYCTLLHLCLDRWTITGSLGPVCTRPCQVVTAVHSPVWIAGPRHWRLQDTDSMRGAKP